MKTKINLYTFCVKRTLLCLVGTVLTTLFFSKAVFANSDLPYPTWLNGGEEYLVAQETEQSASFYEKTFVISAYYSPVKGQAKYVTGSFAGDIRLNGNGVHSADGTPVYPGMIAAPSTYPFGTKMNIPGIGTVAVHDRGGAIKNNRLDVWMGYGDEGLQRAIKWGKRTVNVKVYGVNPDIIEAVTFENVQIKDLQNITSQPANLFSSQLRFGGTGDDVKKLQNALKDLNYYDYEISGVFDKKTLDAVIAFQVNENIVAGNGSYGAGYVGPRTTAVLASKTLIPAAHAKETEISSVGIFTRDLKHGDSGDDVKKLQMELKKMNLFGLEPSGYYGEVTEHAVFKFQQVNRLVGDKSSNGAGIFGPITRGKLNSILSARLGIEELKSIR
jgi:peptidoglycan hydrolase-like protein with peptidoglycan-binding domain/3D (Asp-Asp-Asp) domain-containing protein